MFDPILIESILEAMPDEVAVLDDRGTIIHVNRAWRDFCTENGGDDQTFYLGHNYLEICASGEQTRAPLGKTTHDGIAATLSEGRPFRVEYPCDTATEERWFELVCTPLMLADNTRGALVQHRDISRRAISQRSVRRAFEASELLSAVIATSPDAILTYNLDGTIATWNQGATELYGYTEEEAIGQPLSILYPPDWPTPITEYRDRIMAGELSRFDATRITKTGELREVSISAAPVRRPSGDIFAISNIHRDITDLRRAQEAQQIVAREAAHRSKNILSVVRAIERQTAARAKTLEEFRETFGARLDSLVSSNDMLARGAWTTVSLHELVQRKIDVFLDSGGDRVTVYGPTVDLAAEAVQAVGMALHELATNCTKYGALSKGEGEVRIAWWRDGDGEDAPLKFHWHETGTSFDGPPDDLGFGHVVLTRLAQTTLQTDPELEFAADGLHWRIDVPAAAYQLN